MISFLFSVLDKKIYWDKVYDLLKEKNKSFEMIIVVKQNSEELEDIQKLEQLKSNVHCYVFDDNTSENYMINEGIKKSNGESLVLCRDYFDYAPILSDFLLDMGNEGAQVCMFKKNKKQNKIIDLVLKFFRKFTKNIFGFEMYQGDIGLIYFGNVALSVLKETKNCSILTKVNRWKGFDISYALTDDLPKPKPERKNTAKMIVSLVGSLLSLTVLVTAMVLLICFDLIGFVLILLFCTVILVNILWLLYNLLKLFVFISVGDLQE